MKLGLTCQTGQKARPAVTTPVQSWLSGGRGPQDLQTPGSPRLEAEATFGQMSKGEACPTRPTLAMAPHPVFVWSGFKTLRAAGGTQNSQFGEGSQHGYKLWYPQQARAWEAEAWLQQGL